LKTIIRIVTADRRVRKASAALGSTFVGGLGVSLADGSLTLAEAGVALGAALVATAAVWRVPNKEK